MSATLIAAGALCGAGFWVTIRGSTRKYIPSLERASDIKDSRQDTWLDTRASGDLQSGPKTFAAGLKIRAVQWSNSAVLLLGTDFTKFSRALKICGKTTVEHAWAKVSSAVLWGFVPVVAVLVAGVLGFSVPLWWGVVGILIGVPSGYLLADRQLLEQAEKQRVAFRGAFVAYLDLVKILLAGGSHSDGALYQAAQAGHGQAFAEIRGSLDWSRVHGRPLSAGLARLGDELGIEEVSEVAATINLAETEGSSPSEPLARKAEAAADKTLANAQAAANALTERMSLPTVIIAFAFVVFIAYPALSSLSSAI